MSAGSETASRPDWVRHCPSCGLLDLSARYRSPDEAESDGVWDLEWRCRHCGYQEFDLVEATSSSRGTLTA
jgi:C4-type Zn-finger protein